MPDVWERFIGTVMSGQFRPYDRSRWERALARFGTRPVEVALHPQRLQRNLPQNAKLHVLARAIADASGETLDRVKRRAVVEALGVEAGTERETILGEKVLVARHTSDLSKDECSQVLQWMLDRLAFLEAPEPDWDRLEVMP
jgi:hypothetical protein